MSCGHPCVDFMVPDFSEVRKHSNAIADVRSSEPNHSAASRYIKSFFLHHFSEKVLHFDRKLPLFFTEHASFCEKHRTSAAKPSGFVTDSSQSQTSQIVAIPPPTPAVCQQPDGTAHFYKLWTALPSWSPIIKKANGWITVVNSSGKKVPLVLGTVESHYRRDIILGKRFGQLTNYLLIDIDIHSPHHPRNQGIQSILTVMEHIGLVRYLIVRSSDSEGIHVYFPLPDPVSSWQLAYTAYSALTANGIAIAGGQCELFPNKKSFNAEFNGHRLPLQTGSFLLDEDFCPIGNCKADFLDRWHAAAAHQDEDTLQQALSGQVAFALSADDLKPCATSPPSPATPHKPVTDTGHVIPPIAWTRFGQSNDIMCELVNYGDRYVGLKTVDDLAAWIKAVAPQLPGYEKFASPKSKRDIEKGTWTRRWSRAHFDSAWKHKVGGSDHNANVARDAKQRIFAALDLMCIDVNIDPTKLFNQIADLTKCWFNKKASWRTIKKHKDEIWEYIKRAGVVGLSSGHSEGINSFSSELPAAEISEPETGGKNCYTQLLTLRCTAAIYSETFAQLYTSKIEAGSARKSMLAEAVAGQVESSVTQVISEEDESLSDPSTTRAGLTVGQLVRIAMPGSLLNETEARVVALTTDTLGQRVYRLDYQRQGQAVTLPAECLQVVEEQIVKEAEDKVPKRAVRDMIQATSQQLKQVLGKACPFSGPGLWPITRGDVSAAAWQKLLKLLPEAPS